MARQVRVLFEGENVAIDEAKAVVSPVVAASAFWAAA